MSSRIPEKLVVLEMANNHMGDVEHGVRIIKECAEVCKAFPRFNFAFKLQYRHLDSLIHPDFKDRNDIKYIKRFSETRMTRDQMKTLVDAMRKHSFIPICTPFDEASVQHVLEDGFEIVKVASASLTDWPLLERVAAADKPMICSTAGASLADIDNVVGFLENRKKDFALMHCIAEYPTNAENMQMNRIGFLRARYPQIRFGFSTHELPEETMAVTMAIAKGCTVFEKHVGVPTEKYSNNDYSVNPDQLRIWLKTAERAYAMAGVLSADIQDIKPTDKEAATLHSLRRGVFAKRDITAGEMLHDGDTFLAIPTQDGHVTANNLSKYTRYYATEKIPVGSPILHTNTRKEDTREKVLAIVEQVNDMLKRGNIVIPNGTALEISHHYGIDRFKEYGAALLTLINREYCKKVLVVLPGQKHPCHAHKVKDETLHVLHGTLTVELGGETRDYTVGEMIVVEPGMPHSFESETGAVFEEISSTHRVNDSVYTDESINNYAERKTLITYWNGEVMDKLLDRSSKRTETAKTEVGATNRNEKR